MGNFGGGGGAEAPFTVKMSPLFGENALIAGLESPELPQRESKNEPNRRNTESRKKIDSESPSESHPINA